MVQNCYPYPYPFLMLQLCPCCGRPFNYFYHQPDWKEPVYANGTTTDTTFHLMPTTISGDGTEEHF